MIQRKIMLGKVTNSYAVGFQAVMNFPPCTMPEIYSAYGTRGIVVLLALACSYTTHVRRGCFEIVGNFEQCCKDL